MKFAPRVPFLCESALTHLMLGAEQAANHNLNLCIHNLSKCLTPNGANWPQWVIYFYAEMFNPDYCLIINRIYIYIPHIHFLFEAYPPSSCTCTVDPRIYPELRIVFGVLVWWCNDHIIQDILTGTGTITPLPTCHYSDVMMGTVASRTTSLTTVYSTDYSDTYQRKQLSSASLAFVRGIHRGPVNSPHKWPVTRKMFPFDDVIMQRKKAWSLVQYGISVILPCSMQNLKPIEHLKRMLWKNEILIDLRFRWVSDVYPILHKHPHEYE